MTNNDAFDERKSERFDGKWCTGRQAHARGKQRNERCPLPCLPGRGWTEPQVLWTQESDMGGHEPQTSWHQVTHTGHPTYASKALDVA